MRRVAVLVALATCSALTTPNVARAQDASDKAAAEVLFQDATGLMRTGKKVQACAKFQASQDLDPALGTLLRLADCYDQIGKSASAWALFVEAEVRATRAAEPERAEIAKTRAQDLKARLSKLTLEPAAARRIDGLTIEVNGSQVPEPSWQTPLPYDPGRLRVTASAPGYQTWSTEIDLPDGPAVRVLDIPKLVAKPQAPAPTPPVPESGSSASPRALDSVGREAEPDSSAQATVGYLAGAVGVIALGAGGVLGWHAYQTNQDSMSQCAEDDPNACTTRGKQLRDEAQRYGSRGTIAASIGAGLLLGGFVLVLSAPDHEHEAETGRVWLRPGSELTARGISMGGTW